MAKRFRDLRKGDKLYVCPTEYDIRGNHDLEIESFTIDHTEYWYPDKSVFAMYIKSDKTGMESATSEDTKDENLTHHWYTYTSLSECKEAYRTGTKKQVRTFGVYVNAAEAKAFYVVNGKSADENGKAYSIDL